MYQRVVTTGLAVAGALLAAVAPAASATAARPDAAGTGPAGVRSAAAFSSTIYSAATKTCADVPGGTTDVNVNVVGSSCSGSAEQQFTFQPASGQPAGTYVVVNAASGLCMTQFRFGIRQYSCFQSVGVAFMWTLLPIDAAAHTYVFEPTNQVGNTKFRCMDATSTGPGTALLGKPFYVAGTPTDTFTVSGMG